MTLSCQNHLPREFRDMLKHLSDPRISEKKIFKIQICAKTTTLDKST